MFPIKFVNFQWQQMNIFINSTEPSFLWAEVGDEFSKQ